MEGGAGTTAPTVFPSGGSRQLDKVHVKAYIRKKLLFPCDSLLVHYDEALPLSLTSDVSPYVVGSVLSHTMPDGREAPVAYSSRTLTSTEQKYAHIDKEELSIVMCSFYLDLS